MTRQRDSSIDRDQVILARLARLEHKVDSIDQTTAFAMRADYGRHVDSVKSIFKNGKRRSQVYLAADGQRSVQAIAKHLGMQATHVSRELTILHDEGLLEVVDAVGNATVWGKKAIDRTLRITKFLRDEYQLAADGRANARPARAGKRKPR